jgi:hypothetical protein
MLTDATADTDADVLLVICYPFFTISYRLIALEKSFCEYKNLNVVE